MKVIKFTLALLFLFHSLAYAQSPFWEWEKTSGSNLSEIISHVEISDYNLFVAGSYKHKIMIEKTNLSSVSEHQSLFLSKYHINGNIFWSKEIGKEGGVKVIQDLKVESSGQILILMTHTESFTISNDYYDAGNAYNTLLIVLDSNGTYLHSTSICLTKAAVPKIKLKSFDMDNRFALITFNDSLFIQQNSYISKCSSDALLIKIDDHDSVIWAVQLQGTEEDNFHALDCDPLGNVFVCGTFKDRLYYNSNQYINAIQTGLNGLLMGFDSNGVYIPQSEYLFHLTEGEITSIFFDSAFYITGYFKDQLKFSSGQQISSIVSTSTSKGKNDIFLAKINENTSFAWSKIIGGLFNDYSNKILVSNNDIYISGNLENDMDIEGNKIQLPSRHPNFCIAKVSKKGNINWTKYAGHQQTLSAYDLASDYLNNIYIGGYFYDSINFDDVWYKSEGRKDAFVAKLSGCEFDSSNQLNLKTDYVLCDNDSIKLEINDPSFTQVEWRYNGLKTTGKSITINQPGKYLVKASGASGCVFKTLKIDVKKSVDLDLKWTFVGDKIPHAEFDINPLMLVSCENGAFIISTNDGFEYKYWYNDTLLADSQSVFKVSTSGTYHLHTIDTNTCFKQEDFKVEIHNNPAITLGSDTLYSYDEQPIFLHAVVQTNDRPFWINWNDGQSGMIDYTVDPSIFSEHQQFYIWAMITDEYQCSATDSVLLIKNSSENNNDITFDRVSQDLSSSLFCFPNPTNGNFNILLALDDLNYLNESALEVLVQVFNPNGIKIFEQEMYNRNQLTVTVDNPLPGSYFIKAYFGGENVLNTSEISWPMLITKEVYIY